MCGIAAYGGWFQGLGFATRDEFGIRLSMKDLEELADVGALTATIQRRLGAAVG